METTFHEEERRPRTVLRARVEAEGADSDRERVLGAVVEALDPFPEARSAVLAALTGLRGSRGE
jgi:hypothetical protein